MGRACVELSSAWLQLACRQDQREPQFALTLGCKTQDDHNNTQLQLVRVYIDIGSVTCVDGEAAEACDELLDVCDGPAFWPGCPVLGRGHGHDQGTKDLRWQFLFSSNVVALQDMPARR